MKAAVLTAVNEQIRHELNSWYIYLAMSAHFEAENLAGCAKWMRLQAQEEMAHAMRLFNHLHERGERATLQALEQPPQTFGSALSVFEQALEHEIKVTQLIERVYEIAVAEKDYATQIELQWFIAEQVEEIDTATRVVEQLRMAGDNPAALLMLDREFGARE